MIKGLTYNEEKNAKEACIFFFFFSLERIGLGEMVNVLQEESQIFE